MIVYCDCVYSDVIPSGTKRAVRAALAAGGAEFTVVPDLCALAADKAPALAAFAANEDLVVVACHPRAVRWLFDAAGAPLADTARIIDMRALSPDELLDGLGLAAAPPGSPELPPDEKNGDWTPWFPVLDYDRCRACGECRKFCIFGVYELSESRVIVAHPRNCKNNCPACARLCPQSAIMFPKCTDERIAGADAAPPPGPDDAAAPAPNQAEEMRELVEKRRRRAAAFRRAREVK